MRKAQSALDQLRVVPATIEDKQALANLLELYCHDFCDFLEKAPGPDGRFGYSALDSYWTDPNRLPFFIRSQDRLAGFVLVRRLPSPPSGTSAWDINEFFVLRGLRGRGIGREALRQIVQKLPGEWQVRVMDANQPAYRFWVRAIADTMGGPVEPQAMLEGGKTWHVFSFTPRQPA